MCMFGSRFEIMALPHDFTAEHTLFFIHYWPINAEIKVLFLNLFFINFINRGRLAQLVGAHGSHP